MQKLPVKTPIIVYFLKQTKKKTEYIFQINAINTITIVSINHKTTETYTPSDGHDTNSSRTQTLAQFAETQIKDDLC
jgi:hypothetical protein